MVPVSANAGIFSFLTDWISNNSSKNTSQQNTYIEKNSQNIPLLQNVVTYDLEGSKGGGNISVVKNEALLSENGPSGTLADMDDSVNTGQISRYMVRKGDTLSGIAQMFGVSVNTIVWANDVTAKTLKEGKILVILPVSGTIHTVVKGDTIKTIAKKYKADSNEIMQFNDLNEETVLSIGNQIIIPDGEGSVKVSGTTVAVKNPLKGGSGGPEYAGYYIRPVIGGVKSQKLHGYNGIDIAINVGSPVLASASGQVIISRSSGWNGGYGKYIVISHYNGTQTVYGHLSETFISDGDNVVQGQIIGMTGNTGNSTGPHIHFEIRGAKNPF
jgi:murein DD-endopeptidase MepM/ murein hydrolase activator NlpD